MFNVIKQTFKQGKLIQSSINNFVIKVEIASTFLKS